MDFFEGTMSQDMFLANANLSSRTYIFEERNREKRCVIDRAYDFYIENPNDTNYDRYETIEGANKKIVPTVATACLADIATKLVEVFDNISESRRGDVTLLASPIIKFAKWFEELKKLYSDYYLYMYKNRAISWAHYVSKPELAFQEAFFKDSKISFGADICIEKAEFSVLLQALKHKLIEAKERLTTYNQPKRKERLGASATEIAKVSVENAFPEEFKKALGRFLRNSMPCVDSIVL